MLLIALRLRFSRPAASPRGRSFLFLALLAALGLQMIEFTPPPDEIEKWRKVGGEPTWDKWVKDNDAKGFKEAKEILDTTVKMLKEYKK